MELVNLDNLQRVLEEFAVEVRNLYQDNLIRHDRIASGDLLNSVECGVEYDGKAYNVTLTLEEYWKYIEEGVRGTKNPNSPYNNPGWKAYPFIYKWIEVKPVIPRPSKGKLPSQKSLAYLITRSIREKGTEGPHDLKDAKEATIAKYREKIAEALGHDMEWYIRKVIAG